MRWLVRPPSCFRDTGFRFLDLPLFRWVGSDRRSEPKLSNTKKGKSSSLNKSHMTFFHNFLTANMCHIRPSGLWRLLLLPARHPANFFFAIRSNFNKLKTPEYSQPATDPPVTDGLHGQNWCFITVNPQQYRVIHYVAQVMSLGVFYRTLQRLHITHSLQNMRHMEQETEITKHNIT